MDSLQHRPSLGSMIVWVLFCFVMWGWAILLPLLIVLGIIQVLFDPPFMSIEVGATPQEQLHNLGIGLALAALGLAFVTLRLLGHIRFGDRD